MSERLQEIEKQIAMSAELDYAELRDIRWLVAEVKRLRSAVRWALGEEGTFAKREFVAQGEYYWRSELRRRAFGGRGEAAR